MPDTRTKDARYEAIGRRLIETEAIFSGIAESDVRIAFLSSTARKATNGRTTYAVCEKVPEKNKWSMPYDFTVTVFEPNVEGLDDERIRRLLFHELLHVGVEPRDGGGYVYRIVPHDLEDFRELINRYGTDWIRE